MPRTWTESTLKERLRHVAELRGVSQTALGERAGIQKGEMSNLTRRPRPSAAKLSAIASAWNVQLEWLFSGRGPIELVEVPADQFPNRAIAANIAREGGVSAAAVQSVLSEPLELPDDQPVLWWIHRMERRALLLEGEHLDIRVSAAAGRRG